MYLYCLKEYIKRHPELGLMSLALPQIVQDSIKVLTLSPPHSAATNYIPATNIDINVSFTTNFKKYLIFYKMFTD